MSATYNSVPVSIVISTFEEGGALASTVRSVLSASYVPAEVIIVDDGSTDGSTERDWPPNVHVLQQEHSGIAHARNVGAEIASQPILVFLDAHCSVDQNWLLPILGVLESVPDALVGPSVRDAREPGFAGCGAQIIDPLFTYRWSQSDNYGVREVGLVPGGCIAVRRECFLGDGGFAPFREFGLEDVDLSLRWWRAGHPLLGAPQSHIVHCFRTHAPYRPEPQAWVENVLHTALRHLSGERLRSSVRRCSQFESFNAAIAALLAQPWIAGHERIEMSACRTINGYIEQWAPRAWTPYALAAKRG
ncbi:glycosyltransferase family 2 protein [Azotobacter chroococcum]|uniref:Glycosyltransferase family 2 protein n=1 Tax=Azotobacter chroococcum TaxID=353 RepID=A0AAP9YHI3_9GAMM|nr:glycosyltransferase [Azotobacter chroococcum]QQE89509.1 glycosyltransferase family 2 protein [Azotobacter chroococcum]